MFSLRSVSYAHTSPSKPMDSRSSSAPRWDPPLEGSARRVAGKCSCAVERSSSSEACHFAMNSFGVISTTLHFELAVREGQ